ncbi:hypothetical protein BGX31_010712 [Mortierella sp. GBA43]|nr:hypothetical protein BGX31_010712 [Mortierella sp. GBA43]
MTIRIYVDKPWVDEICVFECKPETTDLTCEVLQGKSVRLNTAILLALEEKGLEIARWHPIIAETRALSVDFYTLRRYDDVIGAGRTTQEKVWLPSGYTQLDAFLSSRSFEVLLGFRYIHNRTPRHPKTTIGFNGKYFRHLLWFEGKSRPAYLSLMVDRGSKTAWKADIDSEKPGADFFLGRKLHEYNLVAYLNHRGATSSLREDLTYEVSQWVKLFSASDKQVLRDVAISFRSQCKTISGFWDEIAEQESQRQQHQRLMDQRKMDLREQNVRQFRIDGDAMTGELEKALGETPAVTTTATSTTTSTTTSLITSTTTSTETPPATDRIQNTERSSGI